VEGHTCLQHVEGAWSRNGGRRASLGDRLKGISNQLTERPAHKHQSTTDEWRLGRLPLSHPTRPHTVNASIPGEAQRGRGAGQLRPILARMEGLSYPSHAAPLSRPAHRSSPFHDDVSYTPRRAARKPPSCAEASIHTLCPAAGGAANVAAASVVPAAAVATAAAATAAAAARAVRVLRRAVRRGSHLWANRGVRAVYKAKRSHLLKAPRLPVTFGVR
jgi:hypothetical protein